MKDIKKEFEENRYFEAPNTPIEQVLAITKDGARYVLKEVNINTLFESKLNSVREDDIRNFVEFVASFKGSIDAGDLVDEYLKSKSGEENK
jgi:hypothetical protein